MRGGAVAEREARGGEDQAPAVAATSRYAPLALIGAALALLAIAMYLLGVVLAPILRLLSADQTVSEYLVWTSGAPLLLGILMIVFDMVVIAPKRRRGHRVMDAPVASPRMTVVLTAYNDASSIGAAVDDFRSHPLAARVLVVDNNSADDTAAIAEAHGAEVHVETSPGYGRCVFRALSEAARYEDTELVGLCEGDRTFRARDLDKFAAYTPHAHVVNGTRIVEQLRQPGTQLTTFMYYGNFLGAKLLEAKHLGRGTVSDVGTTYKVCRTSYLRDQLPIFDPGVNLEFNAHFLDRVLGSGATLVEVPVTFYPRVGDSKGGNVSNWRAARVGARMFAGIFFGWRFLSEGGKHGQDSRR